MIGKFTKGAVAALIAVTLLLPFYTIKAGIPVGTWRSHLAYNNATQVVKAFGLIFVLSEGGIYFFDPADDGLYTIDKTGGLSDTEISVIGHCKSENAVLLVYSNGNIDIIYSNETIYNFTDIKNNYSGNTVINDLKFNNNLAYISTNFGLVVFDVKRKEIKNTYHFDSPVNTSVLINDSLFCGTNDGIYLGLTSDNLLDNANWKMFKNVKFLDLYFFDGKFSGRSFDKRIWTINRTNGNITNVRNNEKVESVTFTDNNQMILLQDTVVSIYDSYSYYTDYKFDYQVNDIIIDGKYWWLCQGFKGLCRYNLTDEKLILKSTNIKPKSPRRNWFHSVSWPQKGRLLAIGGCHNYNEIYYPGTVMIYEKNQWISLDEDIKSKTGVDYVNLTEAAQDPNDPNHIFVGSMGQGLYEFKNNNFYKLHTWSNSGLTSILNNTEYEKNNYVRVSALQYDKYGNLWMANNETDTLIKVLEPDGNWFGLYYDELITENHIPLPTLKQLRFDSKDRIWLNSSRYKAGIICIDTKSTLKNNKDDIINFSGPHFKNQDGGIEEINDIFFYDFDLNGEMWIGTNTGIFVLKDPDNFITNSNPVFERIKIPRNDGSGLADYLFNGVMITALYIDQGNRKWIGTLNDGVFLLSSDGTETLEHFTTKNSPLPSNYILSITENGLDGSLFFGTSLGMVEYGGQARDPEENLLKSNISVYPNPVKPDFDGYVTIIGLTEQSTVRILSNSGRLVHQGTSNGGSYSWNLTDMNGNKVKSGVYHGVITNLENNKSESVSITVIR